MLIWFMNKHILLLNPSPLKEKIVLEAFSKVFPGYLNKIDSYNLELKNFNHIVPKESALKALREFSLQARKNEPKYDYYLSMVGRFDDHENYMEESALVLVQNKQGIEGYSQAASFLVPDKVTSLLRQGVSFSKAVEQVFDLENVKEGTGFVGYLTEDIVTKGEQYFQPLVIALSTCIMKEKEAKD